MEYAGLFEALVHAEPDSQAGHRAYGSVMISNVRREMLVAAAEAYFAYFPHTELEKETSSVLKMHEKFVARRNDIAHGIVQVYEYRFRMPVGKKKSYCLFPAYTTTKAVELWGSNNLPFHPKYAYTSGAIREFATKFEALKIPVTALASRIKKREKQLSKGQST